MDKEVVLAGVIAVACVIAVPPGTGNGLLFIFLLTLGIAQLLAIFRVLVFKRNLLCFCKTELALLVLFVFVWVIRIKH